MIEELNKNNLDLKSLVLYNYPGEMIKEFNIMRGNNEG